MTSADKSTVSRYVMDSSDQHIRRTMAIIVRNSGQQGVPFVAMMREAIADRHRPRRTTLASMTTRQLKRLYGRLIYSPTWGTSSWSAVRRDTCDVVLELRARRHTQAELDAEFGIGI
jgi:hypothetical protein